METHTAVGELLGPDLGEGHLGPFGPGVLLGAPVGVGRTRAAHLEAVDGEAGGIHATRRHGQDAGGAVGPQCRQESGGEQERPKHLGGHGALDAVGVLGAFGAECAGVVDEGVEFAVRGDHRVGECRDSGEVAEVGVQGGVGRSGRGGEGCAGGVGLGRITADDEQVGAEPGEAMGRGKAEARCGAREQDGAPGEVVVVEVGPVLGPRTDDRADAGETWSDRRLEDPIEQLCAHATAAPSRTRMRPAAALSPMRLKTSPRRGSRRASGPRSSSVAS